ncbi:MAG: TrkH family potassium uptake protein, partial [Anaerolineae bacterium]
MTMQVRYRAYLRRRYRLIWGYTGLMCLVVGCVIASPLAFLPFVPQEAPLAGSFLWPALALALPGLAMWRLLTPREPASLSWQEGAVIV